jgi:hypothetical protein
MKKYCHNVRLLNLISGIAMQGFTAISGLILPNLILRTYGSVLNGLLSIITQLMSYLSIVEMGIASASLVSLYKPMAEKDYYRASAIFSAVNKFYQRIAVIFTIGSIGCGFIAMFINKDDISTANIWFITASLAGTNFISYWLLNKYKVLLQSDDKLFIVHSAHIIGIILQFLFSLFVIRWNANISLVKAVVILTNLVEWFLLLSYKKTHLSGVTLREKPAFDSIHQHNDILIHQVLYLVLNHTDVLLLTVFSPSLIYVSIYSIYNMVMTLIHNLANAVIGMFSSRMGQTYSVGDIKAVRAILKKYEIIYNIALFSLYLSMAILIMPFITIYTKGIKDADYYLPLVGLLFSIYGIIRMFRSPYSELISSAGHFKETKNQAVIEVLINLIVSIALLPSMGIPGVLLGSIAGEVYRTIHTYIYCYKKLLVFDWFRSLIFAVINIGVFVVIYNITHNIQSKSIQSYAEFFILAIIVFTGNFVFIFVLNYFSLSIYRIYENHGRNK